MPVVVQFAIALKGTGFNPSVTLNTLGDFSP